MEFICDWVEPVIRSKPTVANLQIKIGDTVVTSNFGSDRHDTSSVKANVLTLVQYIGGCWTHLFQHQLGTDSGDTMNMDHDLYYAYHGNPVLPHIIIYPFPEGMFVRWDECLVRSVGGSTQFTSQGRVVIPPYELKQSFKKLFQDVVDRFNQHGLERTDAHTYLRNLNFR